MKYIIYTIYAATVLLFSGFARANTNPHSLLPVEQPVRSPVTILEVQVDPSLALEVSGYVPTICHATPMAVMTFDQHSPNTLVVRLISSAPATFCPQRIKDYQLFVPLRQLARASHLPLEASAIYTVKTEGHDFAIEVSGQDLIQ